MSKIDKSQITSNSQWSVYNEHMMKNLTGTAEAQHTLNVQNTLDQS